MTKLDRYQEVYPLEPKLNEEWKTLSGKLPVKMTNDYLFRALMQSDTESRNYLIACLLGVEVEIVSTVVENPIRLGESIEGKIFIMDVCVSMGTDTVINLELQVCNQHNWVERSLGYLCREFDRLNRGDAYENTKTAIQFSILDFSLFPDQKEFFAHYELRNIKTNQAYTDKFRLGIIDLTQIDQATPEDRECKLDVWAQLFKAKSWEDMRMVASKNKKMEAAISSVYQMTRDDIIREQCLAREEFYKIQENNRRRLEAALKEAENARQDAKNAKRDAKNARQDALNARQDALNARKQAEDALKVKDAEIEMLRNQLQQLGVSHP